MLLALFYQKNISNANGRPLVLFKHYIYVSIVHYIYNKYLGLYSRSLSQVYKLRCSCYKPHKIIYRGIFFGPVFARLYRDNETEIRKARRNLILFGCVTLYTRINISKG